MLPGHSGWKRLVTVASLPSGSTMSQKSAADEARHPSASDVTYALVRDAVLAGASQRLRHSSNPQLWEIECDYYEGVLTLRGVVGSASVKNLAHAAVVDLKGADEVANRLEVVEIVARPARFLTRRKPC